MLLILADSKSDFSVNKSQMFPHGEWLISQLALKLQIIMYAYSFNILTGFPLN